MHLSKDHNEWHKKFKASMKKKHDKKKGDGEDKKQEQELAKPQAGSLLTIPRCNYVGMIGEGFVGPF